MKTLSTMLAALIVFLTLPGCGKPSGRTETTSVVESGSEKESAEVEEPGTPEERTYLTAAKPFAVAIANRKYDDAYALLSSHAQARMSLNQFDPADDRAQFAQQEKTPMQSVSAPQFRELMKKVEARHGSPRAVSSLSVFSTDPAVLSRQSKEKFGAMDSMFAIGAMPDSVPLNIRRASVRGQVRTELTPEQLAHAAKDLNATVAELQKDADFAPYFNLKIVLVEEGGQLRVGYFEFLPPSMMD